MTYPSFYLKHLTQKLFILHRAKLLRISKLSFPNGLLFAFFVVQTFASLSMQLHKNSIKSAHFPQKNTGNAPIFISLSNLSILFLNHPVLWQGLLLCACLPGMVRHIAWPLSALRQHQHRHYYSISVLIHRQC